MRVAESSGEFGDLSFGDGHLSLWSVYCWVRRRLKIVEGVEGGRRWWWLRDGDGLRRSGVLRGGRAERAETGEVVDVLKGLLTSLEGEEGVEVGNC